ncbi:MAG: DNA mismatch repair endonuclease MutL [Planctomycetes bacterium]|nr:DNA mismatch repair endonuclease MutL [Planctomycetota bacterium]
MPRIQQLSAHVINKIAAGEVIERPASVVKELLENSVDALSTRIEIDIADGGLELIRIVDDGEGIHPEDLPLAVASHATSKLREADDLFRVQTMGFRGEALASIAEVSRFRIRSRRHEAATGSELDVINGVLSPVRTCGAPVGTLIEVADLFCSTPVRRKFLKQPSTEFSHITEQFTKIALAHPRLHLVLRHNDRVVYELPAADKLIDRISLFFGSDLARNLIWIESEFEAIRLWGYVGHPSQSKANRKGQFLFLNGRWIQDRSLGHALGEAYRGLMMVGRNPISFLFLEMPADLVDVNVHPTKAEVRFQESQKLYRQLLSTIRTKFLGMNLNSELQVRPATSNPGVGVTPPLQPVRPAVDPQQQLAAQQDLVSWVREQSRDWGTAGYEPKYPELPPEEPDQAELPRSDSWRGAPPTTVPAWPAAGAPALPADLGADRSDFVAPQESADSGFSRVDPPHVVAGSPQPVVTHQVSESPAATGMEHAVDVRAMQIHDSYLVVETVEGLQVVDQHALHERILYEHLRKRVLSGSIESQRLLVPQPIELSVSEAALLSEHRELLARFGLCLEDFGANTVLVSAYPVMLARVDLTQMVRDAAEKIAESGRDPSRRDLLDSLLHMMSCKGAIKAGQRLSPEEIESLLAQRHLIDDAHHCPHGRPTALMLSRAELDRQFGRLG